MTDETWIAALGVVGGAVTFLEGATLAGLIGRTGEILVWAIGVNATGHEVSSLLPYLLAPVFAGGLLAQASGAIVAAGSGGRSAAATFSSTWAGRRAPGIAQVTASLMRIQRSAQAAIAVPDGMVLVAQTDLDAVGDGISANTQAVVDMTPVASA